MTGPEGARFADYVRATPLAKALADAMQRWDDEGDEDVTFQEAFEQGWSLSEFIALALVRDGWHSYWMCPECSYSVTHALDCKHFDGTPDA